MFSKQDAINELTKRIKEIDNNIAGIKNILNSPDRNRSGKVSNKEFEKTLLELKACKNKLLIRIHQLTGE